MSERTEFCLYSSTGLAHQHRLGLCQKCTFSGPTYRTRNSRVTGNQFCCVTRWHTCLRSPDPAAPATRARSQQADSQPQCATLEDGPFRCGGWAGNCGNSQEAEEARSLSEEAGPDLRPCASPPQRPDTGGEGPGSATHPTRQHWGQEGRARAGLGFLAAEVSFRGIQDPSPTTNHHWETLASAAGLSCTTK